MIESMSTPNLQTDITKVSVCPTYTHNAESIVSLKYESIQKRFPLLAF